MPTFAFLIFPEPGHILPSLTVARSLQDLNYEVKFVTTPELILFFQKAGFECSAIFGTIVPSLQEQSTDIFTAKAATETYKQISDRVSTASITIAEQLLAELSEIPFDILVCDAQLVQRFGDQLVAGISRPIISLGTCFPHGHAKEKLDLTEVVLCPEEFDLPTSLRVGESRCRHIAFAGPSVFRESRLKTTATNGRPSDTPDVLCSLGTQTQRYPLAKHVVATIWEAFRESSLNVAVLAGNNPDLLVTRKSARNITFVSSADQLSLLRHAKIFISHGGLGGLKESIMVGVPSIVIPFDSDQPQNALRVKHHGLGDYSAPSTLTPNDLYANVVRLIESDTVKHALRNMREVFRDKEQTMSAASIIKRVLNV